ncbi:MAG: U32 family peptidase [Clostridiales bacterium]|nr:U32 family peptidase [Clostridiales bacterium]
MEKQIEILAPAGSYESMRAAMNAGCDAVYMGGSRFGARAFAENPDEDLLLKAIDEAHLRNKRLYLTVNTLIKENEIRDLYEYLEKYYLAGLDAVIVQDVGVMKFIHEHFPKLPIHASTQTTITMAQGANLLKSMGVTRLVTARELSFKEIKHIRDNTDMEIETFVHGALCYCYSGQCLMSSMIGGRSGNRGRCAQPCRMPYHFFSGKNKISSDKEPYLLSPKDINTISLIPDLIDAGVESFKIEGRMKSPEYAAGVSYLYRKYVDIYMEEGREKFQECLQSKEFNKDMLDLMDLYNRGGFSEGYGKLYHGKSMMSTVRPNHSGVVIGEVIGVHKGYVNIRLNEDINAQDILEIRNINNEPVYEFTMKDNRDKFETLKANVGYISIDNKGKIKGKKPNQRQKISIGDLVYRTRNNNLINALQDKYIKKDEKLPIKGYLLAKLGEKLRLTLYYNNCHVTAHHNIVEPAIKQPMTKEKLQASIDKLGDSMFYFQELDMEADDDIFVPVSWLNEIRREAILALSHKVIESYRRTGDDGVADRSQDGYSFNKDKVRNFDVESDNRVRNTDNIKLGHTRIRVSVLTKEQFDLALSYKEISSIYLDYDNFSLEQIIEMSKIGSNHGKELYVLLPHICRPVTYMKLEKDISTIIKEDTITGFIVKNNEEIELLHRIYESTGLKKNIRLNHNMYIFNKEAKEFWKDQGINDFTAPLELNKHELKELGLGDCEIIVYGYMPVMVSVQCLYASTDGCSKCQAGESRSDYLLDRLGKKFYVRTNCSSCYNIIYNGQRLSLLGQTEAIKKMQPNGIRLDFTYETIDEMKMVLEAYIGGFVYGRTEFLKFDNITRGHFNRGVE